MTLICIWGLPRDQFSGVDILEQTTKLTHYMVFRFFVFFSFISSLG